MTTGCRERTKELESMVALLIEEVLTHEPKLNKQSIELIRAAKEVLANPPRKEGDWRSALFREGKMPT